MTEGLHDLSRNGDPLHDRIGTVLTELELAVRWSTPCLLLAVYGSEYVRSEAEGQIEDQLAGLQQEIVHVRLRSGHSSLFEYLNSARLHDGMVFFVEGLRWAQSDDDKFFGSLNRKRDLFRQAGLRLVFWVTQDELLDLAHCAAEFWASRDRIIEFLDAPTPAQIMKQALDSAWKSQGETGRQSDDAGESTSLRESLMAALPAEPETESGRLSLLLTLGLLNWRKGDFAEADKQLREALRLAQRAEDARLEAECLNAVALLKGSTGHIEEAIQAYKQALRLAPGQMVAWNNLGSLCSRIGRNDEAIVAFLKAVESDPQDAIAWNGLGGVYHRIGYSEEAISAFRRAVEYMPAFPHAWVGLGDACAASSRVEEAVQAYQRAIDLDPNSTLPWLGMGELFARQDRRRDALRAYQRVLSLEPGRSGTWNAVGELYLKSRAWEDAEEAFLKAVDLVPADGPANVGLALAYSGQGRYSESIPVLLRSTDLFTTAADKAAAWDHLGDVYRHLNDYENAVAAYQAADALVPGTSPASVTPPPAEALPDPAPEPAGEPIGEPEAALVAQPAPSLVSAGIPEPPAALQAPAPEQQPAAGDSGASDAPYWIFEHVSPQSAPAPEADPASPAAGDSPLRESGGTPMPVLQSLNFPDPGREPFSAGLLQPDLPAPDRQQDASPFAWNEKGNIHFKQGAYDQAITAYSQAIELDPAFGWPYSNLALCYVALGQLDQAVLLYQQSIEVLSSDADRAVSWNGLGNVYRAMGDYPNAVAAYQKAGELDPRTAGMREGIQTLHVGPGLESAQVMNDLGEIFLKSGVYTEAVNAFQRAIALDPAYGWPYSNMARTLAMQGQHEQAIPLYQKSIELMSDKKDQAVSWNRLGNSYRRLNDYDNAIKAFREAVALNDEGVNLVTRARFSLLSNCCVD